MWKTTAAGAWPNAGGLFGRHRKGAPPIRLRADHSRLPLVAQGGFQLPLRPHRLVTFLNKALKDRGLIFGLTQIPGGFQLTIYDAGWPGRRGVGEGEQA